MATVEMFLEEKERGLYRVEIEVGFPMLRRKEFFANTGAEALRLAAEAFVEFGVDDRAGLKVMRPALQADIDRAQEAQEAAGDVHPMHKHGAAMWEPTPEWVIPMADDSAAMPLPAAVEYIDPADVDNRSEPVVFKRGPGRPRKEA